MKGAKKIIDEIDDEIKDLVNTDFSYRATTDVPNVNDPALTFGNAEIKKAKIIQTCVLFVDIRGSVALTKKHQTKTMGKLYSAFAKAVVKAAHYNSGYVRNIIGDRVMVVFPSDNCFINAVECAITINHVCDKVIKRQFTGIDFKCGIGVDYGELKVIKVGTPKQGLEADENRGLVWTGYPANLASRLTDTANKIIEEDYYTVVYYPINFNPVQGGFGNNHGLLNLDNLFQTNTPLYSDKSHSVDKTPEAFASSIFMHDDGSMGLIGGKLINFTKKKRTTNYPAILISKAVYTGYKRENPDGNDIRNKDWEQKTYKVKDIKEEVYGAGLTWII